jgi:hypothetical protein
MPCFAKWAFVLSVVLTPAAGLAADYRTDSKRALKLASEHHRAGNITAACAALALSLANYRKAVARDSGVAERPAASIYDDSDGMAAVRAKFGCTRT